MQQRSRRSCAHRRGAARQSDHVPSRSRTSAVAASPPVMASTRPGGADTARAVVPSTTSTWPLSPSATDTQTAEPTAVASTASRSATSTAGTATDVTSAPRTRHTASRPATDPATVHTSWWHATARACASPPAGRRTSCHPEPADCQSDARSPTSPAARCTVQPTSTGSPSRVVTAAGVVSSEPTSVTSLLSPAASSNRRHVSPCWRQTATPAGSPWCAHAPSTRPPSPVMARSVTPMASGPPNSSNGCSVSCSAVGVPVQEVKRGLPCVPPIRRPSATTRRPSDATRNSTARRP